MHKKKYNNAKEIQSIRKKKNTRSRTEVDDNLRHNGKEKAPYITT